MFSRFDCWQYSDSANCWDFVREFLLEYTAIPEAHLPKFGVLPTDKRGMTLAAKKINHYFIPSPHCQFAIACQYQKRTLIHVGVVDAGLIRHTGSIQGTRKDPIQTFEQQSPITRYYLHQSLWPA